VNDKQSDPDSSSRRNSDNSAHNQTLVNVPDAKTRILSGLGVRLGYAKQSREAQRHAEI